MTYSSTPPRRSSPSRRIPIGVPLSPALNQTRQALPLGAGRVAAGFPSPATDHVEQRLDLSEYLVLHPEATFFLRVKGDSMTGAGIHHGDLLIVDRSLSPASGRVVVATLNGELTVKRLQRSRGKLTLKAENPAYPDLAVSDEHDFQIWGVVAHVVHTP
ncbi:MAG: polymerase subunit [Pseudomonadota bacterium]|jgi:DNA polymerase V